MRERSTQCPDCSEAEGLTLRQWKQGYGEVGGGGSMGWGGEGVHREHCQSYELI